MLKDGYQYDYLVIIANFAMLKWQKQLQQFHNR